MGKSERGFTYLGLLFAVVILGLTLSAVGVVWSTQIRRDREAELLFVGDQYRTAIGRYYAAGGAYPLDLKDLLADQRFPQVRRYLRRLYPDPITGDADWQPILGAGGGIIGIASNSQLKPIKVSNFPEADSAFEKAECYCDWKFVYEPGNRTRWHVNSTAPQN